MAAEVPPVRTAAGIPSADMNLVRAALLELQAQPDILILNSTDPVPGGTPAGTVVLRTG